MDERDKADHPGPDFQAHKLEDTDTELDVGEAEKKADEGEPDFEAHKYVPPAKTEGI